VQIKPPRARFDRVWARHVIVPDVTGAGSKELLFVDRNLAHEGGTFLAFDQMCIDGRRGRDAATSRADRSV